MRKDGTAFHIEVFGTSFIYKGKPHALAVLRDITEQVQAYQLLEQRVAERTRELATLLEVSGNLTSTLQLKPLLNQILDQLKEVVDYSGAAIAVVENDELVTLESRRQAEQAHLAPPNLRFPLGQSMHMLQLINSREPVMIGDVRGDDPLAEAYIKFAGEQYETLFKFVRSWLGIPLVLQGRVIGVLSLHHNEPGFYNSHLANLAMAFGSQAAIAIENARLYEQAQERTRELSTLLEISRNLTSTLQLEPLLSLILDQLKKIVDYSGSSIVDIEEGRFVIREGRRPGPPTDVALSALNFPVSSDNPILVTVLDHQQVMIEDIRDDSAFARGFREFAGPYFDTIFSHVRSWLASPLESKGNVTGMLVVTKDEPNYFTAQHAALAWAVANQASIAIENARLYEQALNLAALEERQRLARELHDSVSQALFGISLGTNSTRILLERDPSRVSQSLDYIHSLAQAGMAEMRALLFELRPESLELEGLVAALSKQAAAINARYGIKVQTDFSPEPAIPLASKEALYRIGQEAMHNIVKHAQATRIDLRLEASDDRLVLEISDNGVGFDTQASFPGHLGLRSMKERALKLGGNLQLESVPGQGTHIRVQVPVAVPV
jgi:signal transduction histidine kinase